jgi:threonine dehydrogenase-like Zn-dependent dehydrogenase
VICLVGDGGFMMTGSEFMTAVARQLPLLILLSLLVLLTRQGADRLPALPALVIGCGPVGLAVIAALKVRGHGPIIAADFSPRRRAAAEAMGADVIIDPAETGPHSKWADFGVPMTSEAMRAALFSGAQSGRPVVFECVGAPGVLQSVIEGCPTKAQIIVAGVCMEPDKIEPSLAINKQLDLRFVLGYAPDEFAQTLHNIAEGKINLEPMVTGTVGLDGVAQAFVDLGNPESNVKILVDPSL